MIRLSDILVLFLFIFFTVFSEWDMSSLLTFHQNDHQTHATVIVFQSSIQSRRDITSLKTVYTSIQCLVSLIQTQNVSFFLFISHFFAEECQPSLRVHVLSESFFHLHFSRFFTRTVRGWWWFHSWTCKWLNKTGCLFSFRICYCLHTWKEGFISSCLITAIDQGWAVVTTCFVLTRKHHHLKKWIPIDLEANLAILEQVCWIKRCHEHLSVLFRQFEWNELNILVSFDSLVGQTQ